MLDSWNQHDRQMSKGLQMNSVKYVEWLPLGKPLPKMIGEKIVHSSEYRRELFLYGEVLADEMPKVSWEDRKA